MLAEFIKIERTITKRSYGLDWRDRLIQMSGDEIGGYDLSPGLADKEFMKNVRPIRWISLRRQRI